MTCHPRSITTHTVLASHGQSAFGNSLLICFLYRKDTLPFTYYDAGNHNQSFSYVVTTLDLVSSYPILVKLTSLLRLVLVPGRGLISHSSTVALFGNPQL
jgi:hypothetical protein